MANQNVLLLFPMKNPSIRLLTSISPKFYILSLTLLFAFPAFSQKHTVKPDTLIVRDSIREFMFQGALLSIDALQAKYESQKKGDSLQKQQKAGESQNLFYQSRAYYRKAIALDKNYYPAWNNMGTTYYLQELPKAAIPCYRHALLLNSDYSSAWYNLGRAYDMIGKKDSALYSFRECIRSDSGYVQAYQELSRIIMLNEKDTATAFKYLRLGARYKPTSEVPWVSMADIYFSYKDSAHAILVLENAAKVYNGNVDRLQMLSTYYKNHNDPVKATFYSNLLATEKKKQEMPADPNPDK